MQPSTTRIRRDARELQILAVDLVVLEGPSRGARVSLDSAPARVGSAPGNRLCIEDRTVSRVHCELRASSDSVQIKDCGSTNGTFVEGVRILEGELPPGAVVRVGNSCFRVEAKAAPLVIPLSEQSAFGELIGSSLEMRYVYAVLERLAQSDATLLLEGETGTGKDVAARSLHTASARRDGPFVPINCGAIPESLIESELFGHTRGAFSGAAGERKGVFEEAHCGTLFLDEVGELPLAAQAKLLRALETRSVRPVGSNQERPVDVRIIAATNRSLARAANEGLFREDLYYRLAVVELKLPPLRARTEDIPMLARHFHARLGHGGQPLPSSFLNMLRTRSWPGNVRELRNFVERSVSLGFLDHAAQQVPNQPLPSPAILESIVPLHLPLKDARQAWTESFEAIYVRSMLAKTGGNVTRAAELAGVNRRFLQRLLARLGLRDADPGSDGED